MKKAKQIKIKINLGSKYSRINSSKIDNIAILKSQSSRCLIKESGDLLKISSLKKSKSKVRYKNRCKLTNKSRGYIGDFGASRISLRSIFSNADAPGVTKV